jgi:hypothetical protein
VTVERRISQSRQSMPMWLLSPKISTAIWIA